MDVSATTFTAANAKKTQKTSEDENENQTPKADDSKTLGYDAFLQLLIAQMKNQDPTQPMDPAQHIAQLASFSAVEQSIKTNAKLDSLLTAYALSQADSVIGRTLTSADGETSGKVTSVRIVDGGAVAVLENGEEITLGSGVRIS
jgi:flagellar basal-body rod modification protein FlgD